MTATPIRYAAPPAEPNNNAANTSGLFHTPRTSIKAELDDDDDWSDPESSPEEKPPALDATSLQKRRACRNILTIPAVNVTDHGSVSDSGEVDRERTALPPRCHSAMSAYSFEGASYLVNNSTGVIPITRLETNLDPNLLLPPLPPSPDRPSSSTTRTNWQMKMRTTRSRVLAREASPSAKVNQVNASREGRGRMNQK